MYIYSIETIGPLLHYLSFGAPQTGSLPLIGQNFGQLIINSSICLFFCSSLHKLNLDEVVGFA